ncbi:MAG: hypothetical protein KKA59_06255, partial [Candidatus Omnitrophica bacterium]|nr:hypothetical protein [Candidatus Omnitrophota bacterium]
DKPYRYKISLGKGTDNNEALVFTESSILREVPIKIKLKAEIRNSVMYYKDIPIDLNSQFILTTNKYTAIVVPVLYVKEKWLTVKVKFLRMPPEINPLVAKGHIEKDYAGRIVGRLIEILEASSSQVSVLKVQENKIIFINDPYYKDIIASIEILCSEKDGALYFKNSPVLIGGQITFNSGLYVITGSISGIEG